MWLTPSMKILKFNLMDRMTIQMGLIKLSSLGSKNLNI